jgi:NADH dehydrogenase (ubiquinone) 1 beta subcomplex subunit 7
LVDPATIPEEDLKYVPLDLRNECAHLLLRLEKCREESFYLPWKCGGKKHTYDHCMQAVFAKRFKANMRPEERAKYE